MYTLKQPFLKGENSLNLNCDFKIYIHLKILKSEYECIFQRKTKMLGFCVVFESFHDSKRLIEFNKKGKKRNYLYYKYKS